MRDDQTPPTGTVARTVALLRAVIEADSDVTVAELAEDVRLPRPTVHRLLDLLAQEDMVECDPVNRQWRPSRECQRLGALLVSRRSLVNLARPVMARVVERSQEACLLGVYLPGQRRMTFAAEHTSPNPLSYRIELNTPVSVAWGSSGRSILAFLPPDDIEAILAEREPSPVTGEKMPGAVTMRRELARIREQGYAYTKNQKIPGSRGLAAPILGPDGYAVGSLCLTIPEMRFREQSSGELAEMITASARELSALLGYKA